MKQSQISIESYHKLNRAKNLLVLLNVNFIHQELNGIHKLLIHQLVSYIADDISFVLNEMKDKGLCDFFSKNKHS